MQTSPHCRYLCTCFLQHLHKVLCCCSGIDLRFSHKSTFTPRRCFGPILATPRQKKRTSVTETPTTTGPSSVVPRSSGFKTPGLGRRSWMARDPGYSRENIATPSQSWRQRKPRGGVMFRQLGSAAGSPRGSPKNVLGVAHGECGEVR